MSDGIVRTDSRLRRCGAGWNLGWLFLTTSGTQLRERIDPALDRTLDTLEKARSVLEIRAQFKKSA